MLKVGAASIDITPPIGTELAGYGPYITRQSTGILDHLMSRAVYADDGTNGVLLIANDLVGVTADLTAKTRDLIQKHLGLKSESVMLTSTHTHSGPAILSSHGWGEANLLYLEHLPYAWLELAENAIKNAKPATMRIASGPVEPVGYDRHNPEGPLDRQIRVAMFESDGEPIVILVNHSTHGVVFGPKNTLISADWPGWCERTLEKEYPHATAPYIQGSCGTINSDPCVLDLEKGRPHIERIGKKVAAEAQKRIEQSGSVNEQIKISFESRQVPLQLQLIPKDTLIEERDKNTAEYNCDNQNKLARLYGEVYQKLIDSYIDGPRETLAAEVQAFRIGPLKIVSIPGELFMNLGQQILDARGDDLVMLAGYANDSLGYFPHREAYDDEHYHYPTTAVPVIHGNFPFEPGIGETLVEAAKKQIR